MTYFMVTLEGETWWGVLDHQGCVPEVDKRTEPFFSLASQPCGECFALSGMSAVLGSLITDLKATYHGMKCAKLRAKTIFLSVDFSAICWVVRAAGRDTTTPICGLLKHFPVKVPIDVELLHNFSIEKTNISTQFYTQGYLLCMFAWISIKFLLLNIAILVISFVLYCK